MTGEIKNLFAGGNTAEGFYSFYDYLPWQTDTVYIIKGGPGTGKSTFMKKLGLFALKQGYHIEKHWCSSDNNSLDGLVIPSLNVAFFDGTAPHMIDPVYPGARENVINLGQYWDRRSLYKHRDEIITITDVISHNFHKTYFYLGLAGKIKQEIDSKPQEPPAELIDLKNQLQSRILSNNYAKKGEARHLFARAYTPEGTISFYDNLTENIAERYQLTGNNSLLITDYLQQIAETSINAGLNPLLLHSPLLPARLEAVIINELEIALINSNPEIQFKKRKTDSTYLLPASNNYPEEKENERKLLEYFIKTALTNLKMAKNNHDRLEEYYRTAMDFTAIDNLQEYYQHIIFAKN